VRVVRRKRCKSCGELKVLSKCNFYRCKTNADGFMGDCKECVKRNVYENRDLKADYYLAYDRERNRRPERRALVAAWDRTPAGREWRRLATHRQRRFKALEAQA
jgi:hypothetical protein